VKTSELAKTLARELRKNQSKSEKFLWQKLRNRNFAGFKFTRQHPIYYFKDDLKKFFVTDFDKGGFIKGQKTEYFTISE